MKTAMGLALALACFSIAPGAEQEEAAPFAEHGEGVFIYRPISMRVSNTVLLSFDMDHRSLDCDRTGSCIYEHPACAPWMALGEKGSSEAPYLHVLAAVQPDPGVSGSSYALSNFIAARREFMLRLYGDYERVLFKTEYQCRAARDLPPEATWTPIGHSGIWRSWRGFRVRALQRSTDE